MDFTTPAQQLDLIIWMIWSFMFIPMYVSGVFRQIFTSESKILTLVKLAGLTFCSGLFEVISHPTAPSLSWFLNLPPADSFAWNEVWGVYVLVLMKSGCVPCLYIGSATAAASGLIARMYNYNRGDCIPEHVRYALIEGYEIVHRGYLVTCPIPSTANVPLVRLVIVALEAVFTYVFWTIHKTKSSSGYEKICPWPRESVSWHGLSGHNPFQDPVHGEFDLTEDQRQAMAAEVKEKNRVYQVEYGKNMRANADDEYREKQREANAKRAPVQKEIYKEVKASQQYHCTVCDVSFRNKSDHERHMNTARHQRRVADGTAGYRCEPCGFWNQYKSNWMVHIKTKSHKQKVAGSV